MNDQFDESKLNPEYPHTYLHILGGCHGIAFMSKVKVTNWFAFNGTLKVDDYIKENGKHPRAGSQVKCSHCGKLMKFPPQLLDDKLLKIFHEQNKVKVTNVKQ